MTQRAQLLRSIITLSVWLIGGPLTLFCQCTFNGPIQIQEVAIGNVITFHTTSEEEGLIFAIEKSTNGLDYATIGEVTSFEGEDNEKSYRFLDLDIGTPKAYYRLSAITLNGDIRRSPTLYKHRNEENNLLIHSISPAFSNEPFQFSIQCHEAGLAEISVKSQKEQRIVQRIQMTLNTGTNSISIDLTQEERGVYHVYIRAGEETEELVINIVPEETLLPARFVAYEE